MGCWVCNGFMANGKEGFCDIPEVLVRDSIIEENRAFRREGAFRRHGARVQ